MSKSFGATVKKYGLFLLLTVFVIAIFELFSGCSLLPQGSGFVNEVSQTSTLKPEDPAYAAALFTDPEFSKMISDLAGLFNTSSVKSRKFEPNLESLRKNTLKELLQEDDELLDSLIAFIDSLGTGDRKTLMEKMIQFRTGVDNLLKRSDRHDYIVEIKEPAKSKIVQQISQLTGQSISTPEKLYMDFRDVMLFRMLMEPLIFAYENRVALKDGLLGIKDFSSKPQPSDLFVEQFLQLIEYISNPTPGTDFFAEIATRLNNIAALKAPTNELDMLDIFKENVLKIQGMDLFLKSLDFGLLSFVELYDYEDKKTNDLGQRSDGKETIVTLTAPSDGSLRAFKPVGDEKPFEGNIELDKLDFKFGAVTVSQSTKLIQILRELSDKVPNGSIVVEIKPKTGQTIEDDYLKFLLFKITIDFQKLNKSTLDLKDNNLGISNGFFTAEKISEFFAKISGEQMFQALDLLDPFVTFYDLSISGQTAAISLDIKLFGKMNPAVSLEIQFEIKNINTVYIWLLQSHLLR